MDKGLIIKAAVVIIAVLFLIEPLSMTVQNWAPSSTGAAQESYRGTANINVTVYSYGAILYAEAPTELQKAQILENPEVLALEEMDTESGEQSGVYRITLRDSKKTLEIYSQFKNLGISTIAVAQIGLPDEYTLTLEDGSRMQIHGGYQQIFLEPVLPAGRQVSYLMMVESDGTNTVGILEAKSYYSNVELSGEGTVVGANASAYVFTVPWEERAEVDAETLQAEYGEGNVTYARNDYIVFSPALTPAETVAFKKEYVTYISEGSASVEEGFANRTLAEADFMGRAVFPDSVLQVRAEAAPNLSYGYEQINTYTVNLPETFDGYVLDAGDFVLPSEEHFEINETARVVFNASVTGNTVLGIMEVYLQKAP